MMTGEVWDYPTRILVHSEDDQEQSYLVDLTDHELGLSEQGCMTYNGGCQCKDFLYRHLPRLKKPEFMGITMRCKHIRFAREHALEFMLPKLKLADPNHPESNQI